MDKYNSHFRMNEQEVTEYIKIKLPDFFGDETLSCKEIGDGNINYVFRISGRNKSLIVKQADKCVRSSGQKTSMDHNRIEAEILQIQHKLAPEYIPEVYLYDPVMCCVIMQDIGDHKNMRYEMMSHHTFSTFAKDMGIFLANTLIGTSDISMFTKDKRANIARFTNVDMCEISERLVFTEPYTDILKRNVLLEKNADFLKQEIYNDNELKLQASVLKNSFENKSQSLLHGDLHTGSIFLKEGSTMVLDPEFAFYGPAGYDIGNVIGHLAISWAAAEVTMEEGKEKDNFLSFLESSFSIMFDTFRDYAEKIILKSDDSMYNNKEYAKWYINDILSDTAGYAGTEMIRRVIGVAKVKDITDIQDIDLRARIEKIVVISAKRFIKQRQNFDYTKDFSIILKQASEQV